MSVYILIYMDNRTLVPITSLPAVLDTIDSNYRSELAAHFQHSEPPPPPPWTWEAEHEWIAGPGHLLIQPHDSMIELTICVDYRRLWSASWARKLYGNLAAKLAKELGSADFMISNEMSVMALPDAAHTVQACAAGFEEQGFAAAAHWNMLVDAELYADHCWSLGSILHQP